MTMLIEKNIFFVSTTLNSSMIDNFFSQLISPTLANTHNTLVSCHVVHHIALISFHLVSKNSSQQLFYYEKFFFRTHLPGPN